jgi:small subunit ribosomal protein S2
VLDGLQAEMTAAGIDVGASVDAPEEVLPEDDAVEADVAEAVAGNA